MVRRPLIFALFLAMLLHASAIAQDSVDPEEIIFAQRSVNTEDGHWYANIGYYADSPDHLPPARYGKLCRMNLKTGEVTVLLDDPEGSIRDPQVHYSGKKIVFSYGRSGRADFDLYELDVDGSNLRQLTSDKWDDIEPAYLPDGGIAFSSTRCKRWVPCYIIQVSTIHRCDGDGSNIRPLSANAETDNHPWVLNDGRIVYMRWEYVDRSVFEFHGLWVMNPDGTNQMTFYGNMHPDDLFIDAKPIAGSQRVVMIRSPGHGRREHMGNLSVFDPRGGPDNREGETLIADGDYRDPYPLSKTEFLVAENDVLYRMNIDGKREEIYRVPNDLASKDVWVHEPRPLVRRDRETAIPSQVDLSKTTGTIVVRDAYIGRNMDGIERGAIKKLLIMEILPIPVGFSGGMEPVSWGGTYFLRRILGTVPVEEDGSIHAEVPANRALQLVALDEDDFSVKRMLSFLTVMPGQVSACIGCHESRTTAVPNARMTAALARPASQIRPIADMPEIFDYPRDIQPIWERYCLDCHDVDKRDGGVVLTGDQGPIYTHSYFALSQRLQMADGRVYKHGNYPPYKIGSSASYLIDKIDGSHYGVKVTDYEMRKIKLWIDAGATFPGTYGAMGSGMFGSEMPVPGRKKEWYIREKGWPSVAAAGEAIDRRCSSCHKGRMNLPRSPSDHMGLRIHHMPFYGEEETSWAPPWIRTDNDLRVGSLEWARRYLDPRNLYSHLMLFNLSRPRKSVILLAPLGRS
ncbi:MAG: HzsA-related protein, partial [Planctomycetota bacterium]